MPGVSKYLNGPNGSAATAMHHKFTTALKALL